MVIHARPQGAVFFVGEGRGGQGDDGRGAVGIMVVGAQANGGFVAVHDRHPNVHEDEIVGAGGEAFERIGAVRAAVVVVAPLVEDAFEVEAVHGVVFHDKHAQGAGSGRQCRIGLGAAAADQLRAEREGQVKSEGGSLPHGALYLHRAAQFFDQLFGDRQTEARAAVLFFGGLARLVEAVENMG